MALIHRLQSAGGANRGAVDGLSGTARRVRSGGLTVHLGVTQQLGFSIEDRPGLRDLFKVVVLGILHGLSAQSLALYARVYLGLVVTQQQRVAGAPRQPWPPQIREALSPQLRAPPMVEAGVDPHRIAAIAHCAQVISTVEMLQSGARER
jgi:hypothetical protein